MIPWNFEWAWDIGHYIFFGLFYACVGGIVLGLGVAAFMTVKNLRVPGDAGHGRPEADQPEGAEEGRATEAEPA
ncbi:MAG: hypothetical protein KJ621_08810 [Proteobacteria bacterium]|nr:hypothetical protein [Pseudomonadota bacterium]